MLETETTEETTKEIVQYLWEEHKSNSFPKHLGDKDVNGIDFVMLDADISGCVSVYLKKGTLDVWRTAVLGLCYRNCEYLIPILNEEGAEYYWRLERMAELILKDIRRAK